MSNSSTGELVPEGETMYCSTDPNGRSIILKKQFPEFDRVLRELA